MILHSTCQKVISVSFEVSNWQIHLFSLWTETWYVKLSEDYSRWLVFRVQLYKMSRTTYISIWFFCKSLHFIVFLTAEAFYLSTLLTML